jgi:predicted ferric reductase
MVKFHVVSGTLIITSIYWHVLHKLIIGKMINLLSWIILGFFTLLYLVAILWIEAPGTRHFRRRILKILGKNHFAPYDLLKSFHGYAFLLLGFLGYLHIRDAGVTDSSYAFAAISPLVYLLLVGFIVLYSRIRKLWIPRLTLQKNQQINDVNILTFTSEKSKRFIYRAGQFGYIKWRIPGKRISEEHPFSFLSCPTDSNISMGIKVLGDFTKTTTEIPVGTIIRINGGFGNFIPNFSKGKICLIGSGIGIVPILSLLKDLQHHPPENKVLCFLAVNTREDLLIGDEIERIAAMTPNLEIRILVFQEDHILYSTNFFKESIDIPKDYSYYLCSSIPVRTIVLNALHELEVPHKHFHFEAFSY